MAAHRGLRRRPESALPRREPAGQRSPRTGSRLSFAARCAPAAATWLQAALFGCAALWFGLASLPGPVRRPSLPVLLLTLMAGAMIWMLTVMPAVTGIPPTGAARGTVAPMSEAATPTPVLAVSILLAVSCAAASIPWLARAIGPGRRVKDLIAASQAAMSAGMAAMLFATV